MAHHFILLRLNPFDLGLIGRDGGLSTLCHSCGFACQQRVLKTFPGPGSLRFEDTSITSNNIASNAPRYFWNQFSIDLEKFCYSVFLFNVRKQLSTFSVAFGSRISDRLQYHSLTRSARKTNVFVLYLSLQMNDEYIRLKRTDHKFNSSIIVLSLSVSFSWRKRILYQTRTTNIFVCKEVTIISLFIIVTSFFP